jgi:hypothetical protein
MTLATQATLAALLAKVVAAPATEAKQDTGNTSLATLVTQTSGLATSAGQTSTGTKLDTLHTDLTGTLKAQAVGAAVSGTITALNGVVDGTTDLGPYGGVRITVSGTFTGTISPQFSNDGTTWNTATMFTGVIGGTTGFTGTNQAYGPTLGRYFRAIATAWTSGTANVAISYTPSSPPSAQVQLVANSAIIGGVYIGNGSAPSAFSTTSAASTNATSVKASAGTLFEFTVSNPTATAAYFKLYNKASAPTVGTDIPVATYRVAATGSAGDTVIPPIGANGKRFTTGIAWALTAAAAATDTAAAVAGIQIHGTYV